MDLNQRRGLKDLLVGRNKGSSSKEVSISQVLANLPPSLPFLTTLVGLLPKPDLMKKRKVPRSGGGGSASSKVGQAAKNSQG